MSKEKVTVTGTAAPLGGMFNDNRQRISFWLVRMARKLYPESDHVKSFYLDCMTDHVIYGRTVVRIDPSAMYQDVDKTADHL